MVFSCLEKIDVDAPLPSGISPRVLTWRGQEGLALASLPSSLPITPAAHSLGSHLDGPMALGAGTPTPSQPTSLPSQLPHSYPVSVFLRSNTAFLPVIHPQL